MSCVESTSYFGELKSTSSNETPKAFRRGIIMTERPWSRYYNYDEDFEYQASQKAYIEELRKKLELKKKGIAIDTTDIVKRFKEIGLLDENGNSIFENCEGDKI